MQFAINPPATAQGAAPVSLAAEEQAVMRAAVERVAESVVQVRTIGGMDTVGGSLRGDGPTTGLVISPDGFIVSSAFNFIDQPASILVTFASGRQAPAKLVATDHSRMLVLLKVDDVADLLVPELAPAEEIRAGQWAIAVGRTFRGDRPNVTVGIVSAVGRMYGKVLQTDAAVSMANYGGPLIDIRGRVLGVIVPMAPQGASEMAGVEWYDSGIGFAVPLASIVDALERMKQGEDQRAGILGISMAGRNPRSSPAELAVVRPGSPAGHAGLKKGDRIVEIEGQPIHTQTDLRFALGTRYGGESVEVVVERGAERMERTITLAGELEAFRHAFLGVLPMRPVAVPADGGVGNGPEAEASESEADDGSEDVADEEHASGVVVRAVFPGSPAAEAGVQPGDRLVAIDETPVADIGDAIQQMNSFAPGMEVTVHMVRDGQPQELSLTMARLSASVPGELPPVYEAAGVEAGGLAANAATGEAGGTHELKLPEFQQECRIYVPASGSAERALGVLLWLHAPGASDPDAVIRRWQPICDRDGLLLVVPTASDPSQWERTELEYLRRLLERVIGQQDVDPRRVVVYGEGGGGAMATLLSLSSRDIVSGLATLAAPLPRQVRLPPNEPAQRLAVFAGVPSSDAGLAAQITQSLRKLIDGGYPVTPISVVNSGGQLSDEEQRELARWIDSLDRF